MTTRASITKIDTELFNLVKYLHKTKVMISTPPVDPPPKKVIAHPVPIKNPPNNELSKFTIASFPIREAEFTIDNQGATSNKYLIPIRKIGYAIVEHKVFNENLNPKNITPIKKRDQLRIVIKNSISIGKPK